MAPVALIAKIFIYDFWLIGEEKNEARDNAFWLFKYIRENHPKQKIAYVINKKCADYQKVKNLGKVIKWGGISHWFWYLVARKNISSQKGCKPNAAACYFFEIVLRIWRNKRYFLQHGITVNNPEFLHYKKTRFKLFVCGAQPEFEYVKQNFGYPENFVQHLGFCRFDHLVDESNGKNQILVMPTWRNYLARSDINQSEKELRDSFTDTDYFKSWSEFLNCEELIELLNTHGKTVLFYPHRNMQKFLPLFEESVTNKETIKIADPKCLDIQVALKESELLITDYSSVFFDFAYMEKPVVFYQFDEEEFRKKQYKPGYFDYGNNPIGEKTINLESLVQTIKSKLENEYVTKASCFFTLKDDNNCKRNYFAIKTKKKNETTM